MTGISRQIARRLLLNCQGLGRPWKLPKGKEGAAQALERLGYIQIDTISVVERAHHHIFWTRCPDYQPAMLDALTGGALSLELTETTVMSLNPSV